MKKTYNLLDCYNSCTCDNICMAIHFLFVLYQLDKEKYVYGMNKLIYQAVYKMNIIQPTPFHPKNAFSVNLKENLVIYIHDNERDSMKFDPSIKMVDVTNQAMYDIRSRLWTLKRVDSLFRCEANNIYKKTPVSYQLINSFTGKVIQSYVGGGRDFRNEITGEPIKLGFITKHELHCSYPFPLTMLVTTNLQIIFLLIFILFFLVFFISILFHSFCQLKLQTRNRDLVLSTIIHNLRSPLNDVVEARSQLQEEIDNYSSETVKILLDGMQEELKRMFVTITHLLNLHSTFNGIKVNPKKINLPLFLLTIVNHYTKIIPVDKRVNFVLHLSMKNNSIIADPILLTEIIQNLLENAIKYSAEIVEIRISCEECGDKISISIKDDGFGISKKSIKQVFKPYSRQSGVQGMAMA